MFRETAGAADQTIDELLDSIERHETDRRSAWVLSAVEAYKAACRAAGEEPSQEDIWLVVLSALQLEEEAV
ncbi:MAG TPA: hypothetical protein VFX49_20150 [Chloroflexota bacterium]|nr:hypothetical protein [Chloroflexota bacterium]